MPAHRWIVNPGNPGAPGPLLRALAGLPLGLALCLGAGAGAAESGGPGGTAEPGGPAGSAAPGDAARQPLRLPGPLSPRNASYRISARLDEAGHKVTGKLLLSWRNLERQPAERLVFHLYQNAFKNRASTFAREAGLQLRGDEMPDKGYGAIDVTALRVGKRDLLARAEIDDTLMTVPLPEPVGPGAGAEVEIEFTTTLPKAFARSGWAGSFHAVSQWFPKIGVFDCASQTPGTCRWRASQYHANTEFFADYGVYEVELDVPARTVVGATGVLQGEGPAKEPGRKLLRYRAEDVHDFVWMTDPAFIEVRDELRDDWGAVSLRLLTRRGSERMNERHLRATREGLLELERRFGPYPYRNVTIVVPPPDGQGAGGMEYPTLFTTVAGEVPESVHLLEGVTVHELGHQYFYGILGSDEVEEAWLDEGLNDTFTTWGMERLYGPRCNAVDSPWMLGLCVSEVDLSWLGARSALRRAPVATPGYEFPPGTYAAMTYAQTTLVLRTMERLIGPQRMEAAMRRYAERYRFQHPRQADFVAAFDEGAGEDLRWYWDQALSTSRVADYAVLRATTTRHEAPAGLWDCPPRAAVSKDPAARALAEEAKAKLCGGKGPGRHLLELPESRGDRKNEPHDSEVWVWRRGELVFPVSVRLRFADGSTVTERWTLEEQRAAPERRARRLRYEGRAALERVEVDPDGTLLLDERRLNNGLLLQKDPRPPRRIFLSWLALLQAAFDWVGV